MYRLSTAATLALLIGLAPVVPAMAQAGGVGDDSWIGLSGTVEALGDDHLVLDYGKGTTRVDLGEWRDAGAEVPLVEGDLVTVLGTLEGDLDDLEAIDASSIRVDRLTASFYASPDDERTAGRWVLSHPALVGQATVRGEVVEVNAITRNFTLDTGAGPLLVHTPAAEDSPDEATARGIAYTQIDAGDRLSVTGMLRDPVVGEPRLEATGFVRVDDRDG